MYIIIDYDSTKDMGILKTESLDQIREAFSEADPKASLKKFIFKNKGRRFIPTRQYAITESGRFPMGLLPDIVQYLKTLKTPFRIVFSESFKNRYQCSYSWAEEPLKQLNYTLRDYQEDGVRKALKNGCGILVHQTGSGKTLTMASIIENVRLHNPNTKVLLVTLTHIIDQIYDEFITYGIDPNIISKWSGTEELNPNAKIVICGTNILYSKIDNIPLEIKKVKIVYLTLKKALDSDTEISEKERFERQAKLQEVKKDLDRLEARKNENEKTHEFFNSIDLLIFDEIHTCKKSNEINNLLKYIHTRNRFGVTGTLPETKIDVWNIIGNFGPILHQTERAELVANKHIADVDIRILELEYKIQPDYSNTEETWEKSENDEDEEKLNTKYQTELNFIHHNQFRNNIIKKISEKMAKNILIIVDRLEQGEVLLQHLKTNIQNKEIYYIKGEVEDEERQRIQAKMEMCDNIVCIAMSKIFSTGVNIKNLHYIIFASAGKAKIKIIQSIGRGIRKLDDKIKVVILDIADHLLYGIRHLEQRKIVYDNEKLSYQITKIKET